MAMVNKSDAAKDDLANIWLYIAEDSIDNADRFIDMLEQTLYLLATQPMMGRLRENYGCDLRSHPEGRYVIFYYPRDYGIEIVRVLHGSLNFDNFFEN